MGMMALPVLFKEISEDLGLSLVQVGTVWGMSAVGGVFLSLIGGLLGDRFGVKRVIAVGCVLTGLAGALRGLSGGFAGLTVTMLLFGLMIAILPPNVYKSCGLWFPRRQQALAQGIVALSEGLGGVVGAMISATIMSPLLGGWRNVMFFYGAISMALGILWLLSPAEPARVESPAGYISTVPFRQALSRVVRIGTVWVLGLISLGQMSCGLGMQGYLPLYLQKTGWTAAGADGALATSNVAGMIGVIPMTVLSDRLGSRKAILFAATLITAISVGLLSVAGGAVVWVVVIIAGIVRSGLAALSRTMVVETKGVGAAYAGTALGLTVSIARLGSIISPPLGNSLGNINLGLPFVLWGGLAAVSLFGFYFIKETGGR